MREWVKGKNGMMVHWGLYSLLAGEYRGRRSNVYDATPFGLYETPATLNDSWGYCAWDHNWKSPETIASIRRHLNELGINYLLNVGSDGLGRIPAPSLIF